MSDTVARYSDFFRLFGDFQGYVDFFLLQDLVTEDRESVEFFASFADFATSPLPDSVEAHVAYRRQALTLIEARNRRMVDWCAAGGVGT